VKRSHVKPPDLPAIDHGYVACFARPAGRGELPFHCVQFSCFAPPAMVVPLVQKCAFHCLAADLVLSASGEVLIFSFTL
jgi:hypothetical protein